MSDPNFIPVQDDGTIVIESSVYIEILNVEDEDGFVHLVINDDEYKFNPNEHDLIYTQQHIAQPVDLRNPNNA